MNYQPSNSAYPNVPQSITNPDIQYQYALDRYSAFSFIDFAKINHFSYEPETLNEYYNFYILKWYEVKNIKNIKIEDEIHNRYIDFLYELTLNYTTYSEKKFLSKLDLSNENDLKIAIPFFSKKLKEIALYYKNTRDDAKFELTRKKIKGSIFGTEKRIHEILLSHLAQHIDKNLKFDYAKIKENLKIEIEELYDGNAEYFNDADGKTMCPCPLKDHSLTQ